MDWAYNRPAVLVPLDTLAASLRTLCTARACTNTATYTLLEQHRGNNGGGAGYCADHAPDALSDAVGDAPRFCRRCGGDYYATGDARYCGECAERIG
jgi:hypothetical protein